MTIAISTQSFNEVMEMLQGLEKLLVRLERFMDRFNQPEQGWFSTDEVARMLSRSPFTIRDWCRKGRISARKRDTGRGIHREWEISASELQRVRQHGLRPVGDA